MLMHKLIRSAVAVIVAMATLATPVGALADPVPPTSPAKPVAKDITITKTTDKTSSEIR